MVRTESDLYVLGLNLFDSIYDGKKVLVTGHTGFKGSWLSLWLSELGAEVTGLSLPPETEHNHWNLLNLTIDDRCCDIRDAVSVKQIIKNIQPEIVFHLAAQPLVRRSYRDPLETWSTNVMGTANVLEACRHTPSVQAIVAITTDKCYENYGYLEAIVRMIALAAMIHTARQKLDQSWSPPVIAERFWMPKLAPYWQRPGQET